MAEVCIIYRCRRRKAEANRRFGNSRYHTKTEFNICFAVHIFARLLRQERVQETKHPTSTCKNVICKFPN